MKIYNLNGFRKIYSTIDSNQRKEKSNKLKNVYKNKELAFYLKQKHTYNLGH